MSFLIEKNNLLILNKAMGDYTFDWKLFLKNLRHLFQIFVGDGMLLMFFVCVFLSIAIMP